MQADDAAQDGFWIGVRRADGVLTVEVHGPLDMATAPQLRVLTTATPTLHHGPTVIDLAAMTFVDATGVDTLREARVRADADGIELVILPPAPALLACFHRAGLAAFFLGDGNVTGT